MNRITSKCINGLLAVDDIVLSTGFSEYSFLIGRVLSIDLLGTPEHDTENQTDDVHVDFTAFEYSLDRILEIEDLVSKLYGEEKTFEDCALDDVIMPPKYLLRITDLDKSRLDELLEDSYLAACYIIEVLSDLLIENIPPSNDSEGIKRNVFDVIGYALPLAGYKVMDSNSDLIIIRHRNSDSDFEVKVRALVG